MSAKKERLSPKESRQGLIDGVSRFLHTMRQVFRNNRVLYESIDDAYAMLLADQIRIIPNDWIVGSYETFMMLEGMVNCFDFRKLNNVIQNSCSKIWFAVDSYSFMVNHMFKALDVSPDARAICTNLMKIFIPLCNCIDHIFAHPEEFVQRLADLSETDENNDIFK